MEPGLHGLLGGAGGHALTLTARDIADTTAATPKITPKHASTERMRFACKLRAAMMQMRNRNMGFVSSASGEPVEPLGALSNHVGLATGCGAMYASA